MPSRWHKILSIGSAAIEPALAATLLESNFAVDRASSAPDALEYARHNLYSICCLLDRPAQDAFGEEGLRQLRELQPKAAFVIVSGAMSAVTMVSATGSPGEYLICPASLDAVASLARRIASVQDAELLDFAGASPKMLEILEATGHLAAVRSPVMIHGDPGSEVGLVARTIHDFRSRDPRRFVHIKCASLTKSALSGHLAALESANAAIDRSSPGTAGESYGGTIFLDRVENLSPILQAEVMGALRRQAYGGLRPPNEFRRNFGVLAGTEVDLEEAVLNGKFLEELFFHLNVLQIRIAPLRVRREDVRRFIECVMIRLASAGQEKDISREAMSKLIDHSWPGNLSQLANAMERAIATSPRRLMTEQDFELLAETPPDKVALPAPDNFTLKETERVMINAMLGRTGGNIKKAAMLLGINRSTLYEKMKRYGVTR